MIGDETYADDDITVITFPLSKEAAVEYKEEAYDAGDNPSIEAAEPDWEIVFPDGTFHENTDDNLKQAKALYQERGRAG